VAPVTKIVLFSKKWSTLSNSMGEEMLERERAKVDGDLRQEVDYL
jgi:hypothetical protein